MRRRRRAAMPRRTSSSKASPRAYTISITSSRSRRTPTITKFCRTSKAAVRSLMITTPRRAVRTITARRRSGGTAASRPSLLMRPTASTTVCSRRAWSVGCRRSTASSATSIGRPTSTRTTPTGRIRRSTTTTRAMRSGIRTPTATASSSIPGRSTASTGPSAASASKPSATALKSTSSSIPFGRRTTKDLKGTKTATASTTISTR